MAKAATAPARVLVGFDGSEDAQAALAYGVARAKADDAELAMVYAVDDTVLNSAWGVVFDPDEIKRGAGTMLDEATDELVKGGFPRDRVRTSVVLGAPPTALARLSEWASLIVVGRCSGASERAFVGSTAVGVAAASRCPVAVVGADTPLPEATHSIGVGVNVNSGVGSNALPWALAEARRTGASLTAISVAKAVTNRFFGGKATSTQQDQVVAVTKARADEIVAAAREGFADVEIAVEVSSGSPVDTLVARSADFDLLVVEVQTSFPTYAVSGVARGVMTHARCPVVLLRAKDIRATD